MANSQSYIVIYTGETLAPEAYAYRVCLFLASGPSDCPWAVLVSLLRSPEIDTVYKHRLLLKVLPTTGD